MMQEDGKTFLYRNAKKGSNDICMNPKEMNKRK